MSNEEKVRVARLRRAARDQGYLLVRSRRRDERADDFGLYVLASDKAGNTIGRYGGQEAVSAFANGEGMTLDAVEDALTRWAHSERFR